jgi:predicted nucleic acid-binding protein
MKFGEATDLMNAYFDTEVLLKAYIPEKDSALAISWILRYSPPLPLSHLLELEFRTAIRLKFGRGEIDQSEMQTALSQFDGDIAAQRFVFPPYDLRGVFILAEKISGLFAPKTKARTADLWHVAAAKTLDCKEFISTDQRQREIAKAVGLKVFPK